MLIEISENEKTALSILVGLRQKFALAKKKNESYSALELHKMFSEVIQKINKGELRYLDTIAMHYESKKEPEPDPIWDEINKQVERSTIERYNWKKVFGNSLTQEILKLKKAGHDVAEAYKVLKEDKQVINFLDENKGKKRKILENLKISVHARYGENNTANKVMGEEDDP